MKQFKTTISSYDEKILQLHKTSQEGVLVEAFDSTHPRNLWFVFLKYDYNNFFIRIIFYAVLK